MVLAFGVNICVILLTSHTGNFPCGSTLTIGIMFESHHHQKGIINFYCFTALFSFFFFISLFSSVCRKNTWKIILKKRERFFFPKITSSQDSQKHSYSTFSSLENFAQTPVFHGRGKNWFHISFRFSLPLFFFFFF